MTSLTLPLASDCALTAQIISSRQPLPASVLLTPMTNSPPPPSAASVPAASVSSGSVVAPAGPAYAIVNEKATSAAAAAAPAFTWSLLVIVLLISLSAPGTTLACLVPQGIVDCDPLCAGALASPAACPPVRFPGRLSRQRRRPYYSHRAVGQYAGNRRPAGPLRYREIEQYLQG